MTPPPLARYDVTSPPARSGGDVAAPTARDSSSPPPPRIDVGSPPPPRIEVASFAPRPPHRAEPLEGAPREGAPLEGALLAVVALDTARCEEWASPLRRAGALVRCAVVHVDALATLSAPGFDAVVLDTGDDPESFVALALALRDDPRTRALPVVVLPSPAVSAGRLAGLGPAHVVERSEPALVAAIVPLVAQRRALAEGLEYARALEERLRAALDRLVAMRSEAQAVMHDARVLCGIVVGFAANLRDGIAGPLEPMQRDHVAQILEATKDTTALVERFGQVVRAQTDLPPATGSLPPPNRRANRRTLLDLVELTRATLQLFTSMAERQSITLALDAPAPVAAWGDAMQIKQVITNLLVNAIKFTPSGGHVTVALRSITPGGAGPGARTAAEIVVLDTGPGIPVEDRERVFERGVRLERDRRLPGSGVGLAVVREMVAAHGGTVHVEDAPGGGATLRVRLPLDMRTRRDSSVVLVEDPSAARRIVGALRSRHDGSVHPLPSDANGLASALESCRAVVVVPHGPRLSLDELLSGTGSEPSGHGDEP